MATPNPGSKEAGERGCTCSVYAVLDGGTLYNYNADCPLHGALAEAGYGRADERT